jgi:acyl carrier protein
MLKHMSEHVGTAGFPSGQQPERVSQLTDGETCQRRPMTTDTLLLKEVQDVILRTLGIDNRARVLDPSTPLFGSMPELDSLTVIELAIALETRFGFEIDDIELSAEIFETVGSVTNFVRSRAPEPRP